MVFIPFELIWFHKIEVIFNYAPCSYFYLDWRVVLSIEVQVSLIN